MQRLEVDDTSPAIGYSAGQWTGLTGSSRQWISTIHSTGVQGAMAAMNFQAARVVIYCTVPIGIGKTVHATVVLDGRATTVSRPGLANGTAIYANILFDSGPIADVPHTITLTNTGSTTDSPLQLDRFHLEGTVFNPTPGKVVVAQVPTVVTPSHSSTSIIPTLSSTSTPSLSAVSASVLPVISPIPNSSSNSSTVLPASTTITDSNGRTEIVPVAQDFKATATPSGGESPQVTDPGASTLFFSHLVTSTEADGTVVTQIVDSPRTQSSSTSGHIPKAAIAGGVAGALVVLFAVILILFRLKKRRSNHGHMRLADERTEDLTGVNPFDIHERSRTSQSSSTRAQDLSEFRDEKRKSAINQTRDLPATEPTGIPAARTGAPAAPVGAPPAPAPAPAPAPGPQTLPNIMVEFGHGSYVFVPHHQHAVSTPSVTSPETPSSLYSTAVSSTAMLLSTEASDMPPSYQMGV